MKITRDPNGQYVGLYTSGDIFTQLDTFASETGRQSTIVHLSADWAVDGSGGSQLLSFTDPNPAADFSLIDLANELADRNTVLAVSWDPMALDFLSPGLLTGNETPEISLQRILDGEFDSYIRTVAQEVADFAKPMMLGLMGELNSYAGLAYGANGDQYYGNITDLTGQYGDPSLLDGPERVKDVHRYIIDLFREEGATNVSWYQYMGDEFMKHPDEQAGPEAYYAGDDYIDWVGQSLYIEGSETVSQSMIDGYNAWAAITDKPFFIPEIGVVNAGADGVQRLMDGLADFPNVGAYTFSEFDTALTNWDVTPLGANTGDWTAIANQTEITNDILVNDGSSVQTLAAWQAANPDVGNAGRGEDIILDEVTVFLELDGDAPDTGTGNALDNTIIGNVANNVLMGLGGNDVLDGGGGADTLMGGIGDDTYFISNANVMVVEEAGEGADTIHSSVDIEAVSNVETLILDGSAPISGNGGEIGNLINGNFAGNILRAGGGDDTVFGEAGADKIFGQAGNDLIQGGSGNDFLNGGSGIDSMFGGTGDDKIALQDGGDFAVGGAGADVFLFQATDGFTNIEDFNASEDRLDLSFYALADLAAFQNAAIDVTGGVYVELGPNEAVQLFLGGTSLGEITLDSLIL